MASKSGSKITLPSGLVVRATEGGNYRDDKTGKVYTPAQVKKLQGGSTATKEAPKTAPGLLGGTQTMPTLDNKKLQTAAGQVEAQQKLNEYNAGINANLNRYDMNGPSGSSSWVQDPNTGKWSINTALNAGEQQVYDTGVGANQIAGKAATNYGNKIDAMSGTNYDLSGVPQMLGGSDLLKERQRLEGTINQRFDQRNQPVFDKQKTDLQQQLADQGIPIGSKLYNDQMMQLSQRQGDERQTAALNATTYGGTEATNQFDMSQKSRVQGISDYEKQRYAPMTEFSTFKGLNTGANMPESAPASTIEVGANTVPGAEYANMANQKDIAKLQANTQLATARIASAGGGGSEGPSAADLLSMQGASSGTTTGGGTNYNNQIINNSGTAAGTGVIAGATNNATKKKILVQKKGLLG